MARLKNTPGSSVRSTPIRKPLRILPDEPIERRIADGLARLVDAGRVAAWHEANAHGLSSTQAQVISELARQPMRLSDVATALGVSTATTSDAVRVLVQKGLVEKGKDPTDGRAVKLELTADGRKHAPHAEAWRDVFVEALQSVDEDKRADLLCCVAKLMQSLQESQALSVARTCLTCVHFQPQTTGDDKLPHYCDAYDAAYSDVEIRTNCPKHEPISV
jgi:DNA-binding MarR family transcriptional regulator